MTGPKRLLLVTGMSGAGRTTALKTLEDMGWETVDNLPLSLVDRLLASPPAEGAPGDGDRPLAVGVDSRTRGFGAAGIVARVERLRAEARYAVEVLFFDATGVVLQQRYSETRRRHPLAADRPAEDGIARERELMTPLREAADHLIDTSDLSSNALRQELRDRFGADEADGRPTLAVTSFGFKRGLPRDADLVFDMRFLRNPHWVADLRPQTGLDRPVADYVADDPAYPLALERIEALILQLLPRYAHEGKSYVTVAFGCTGGRHRSVHVAERVAETLRAAGFSPTVAHRDLAQRTHDASEGRPDGSSSG